MATRETLGKRASPRPRAGLRLLLAAGIGLALGSTTILVWGLERRGDDSSGASDIAEAAVRRGSGAGPIAVSAQGLKTLAFALRQPIYWAGPQRGYMYSLRQSPDNRFYVRYLPPGVKATDTQRELLTVATYPIADAFKATQRKAHEEGGVLVTLTRGGLVYYRDQSSRSAYFASRGSRYQVEVYDPSARRARTLILTGRIVPVR